MTAVNVSAATGGRAEVRPGLVLAMVATGALERLGAEAGRLGALAQVEVPTATGRTWVFAEDQGVAVLEETARVLRAAAQDGWPCAAGLASGRVGQLQAPGQPPRVIGAAVDRAGQMGEALQGRPGTLLADDEATRVCGLQASAAPLLGSRQPLDLTGSDTLDCAEVLWDRLRPGDLSTAGSETAAGERAAGKNAAGEIVVSGSRPQTASVRTARPAAAAVPATRPRARPVRTTGQAVATPPADRPDTPLSRWVRGTVLRTGRTFGFLEDVGGLIYYFQPRNVAIDVPLRRGARVIFRVLPALRGASELRAEDVFVIDAVTTGLLERVHPNGWGLVRLDCQNGLEHRLFVQNASGPGWRVGKTVSCRIGANRQGPVGLPISEPELATD